MFNVITNVETVETEQFLVVIVFGHDGYLADYCCPLYQGVQHAVEFISNSLMIHGETSALVWTSNNQLYTALLNVPGLAVEIKHRNDTNLTKRYIDNDREILIEFYGIKPSVPLPKLPKWRKRLLLWLEKITNIVRGEGYEI
jgi:hypothetical protein